VIINALLRRTPQRIPQVSKLRDVFISAILRNRSRRSAGMKTLRRSCPFSKWARIRLYFERLQPMANCRVSTSCGTGEIEGDIKSGGETISGTDASRTSFGGIDGVCDSGGSASSALM
jgi:hypothetical protein